MALPRSRSDAAQVVAEFEAVLRELTADHGGDNSSQLADRALSLVNDVPALDFESREHRTAALQLHTTAINLWNLAVGLKTAGGEGGEGNASKSKTLNAQLRHVSCSLVFLSSPPNNTESSQKKLLTMAVKTGRAWLDGDTPSMAGTSLALARDCWDKLARLSGPKGPSGDVVKQLFKILCFQAEAAVGLDQEEQAMGFVHEAHQLVSSQLEKEGGYLSMLCYNFGLDAFQKGGYESSVSWLKESYELGQECLEVGAVKQSRTLRLLANAYLEWDSTANWQKALNAVGLANSEHSHPTGFYLKTYVLLKHDTSDSRLRAALEETLHHADLTTELALATVQLFAKHQRVDLALSGLRMLAGGRFRNSPDIGKFQLLHLEILLEQKQVPEAKDVLEDVIIRHNSGLPLDVNTRKSFHLILWEQAAAAMDREDYREAVMWYNYSHNLFTEVDTECKNLAKLQRNRCHCYILLEEFNKASLVLGEALEKDGDNPFTQFMAYKLAMAQGDEDKAQEAVSNMSSALSRQTGEGEGSGLGEEEREEGDDTVGLICLAAQVAFERSTPAVAVKTLEHLVKVSHSTQQVLTSLRCLTRLRLTLLGKQDSGQSKQDHISATVRYIENAYGKLRALCSGGDCSLPVEDEAVWFMKVAWNLALQCHKSCQSMFKLFRLCSQLLELCEGNQGNQTRRHTCLLMSAAACLQMAREAQDDEEKVVILKDVLQLVDQAKMAASSEAGGRGQEAGQAHILVMLYEFEAKSLLGMEGLDHLLQTLAKVHSVEPKTFETVAALAMHSKVVDRGVCEQALRMAVERHHKQGSPVDYSQCSKCYHSLVQLHMDNGGHHDAARLEKAWKVIKEALKALKGAPAGDYPEVEVLWLLTKTWNCGVRFFSGGRHKEAEQWCSLSMEFLEHLSTFKDGYQQQMSSVYSEILNKLTAQQAPGGVMV